MTPFEYLTLKEQYHQKINDSDITKEEFQVVNEQLKKLFALKEKEFPLYTQSMKNNDVVFSPHDGTIHSLKMSKNGLLSINFSSFVYKNGLEEDYQQKFDLIMKLEKLPAGGISLKRDAIIMDIVFTEKEFAIHFLHPNDHSQSLIESFDISALDISRSSTIQHDKFIPKEFKNKKHSYYKP